MTEKTRSTTHASKFSMLAKQPWLLTAEFKKAFMRGVLKLENVYQRFSGKCIHFIVLPFKVIIKRKVSVIKKPLFIGPKEISIFGANPEEVSQVKKTCEALAYLAGDLGEPEHYIQEKKQHVRELASFLSVLRSPQKELCREHYILFLKAKNTITQESIQMRVLLEQQCRQLEQEIKKSDFF